MNLFLSLKLWTSYVYITFHNSVTCNLPFCSMIVLSPYVNFFKWKNIAAKAASGFTRYKSSEKMVAYFLRLWSNIGNGLFCR